MPCDSGQSYGNYDYQARNQVEQMTRVSCDIMRMLQAIGADFRKLSPETRQWWDEHVRHDAERTAREAEAARKAALGQYVNKLTPDGFK